jgi:uncharacterized protein
MSGRSTSLAAVMRACGVPVARIVDGWAEQHFVLHTGQKIAARVSTKRAHLYYPSEGEPPEAVREEIDWLCSADGIVFVVDSHSVLAEANTAQLAKLRNDLAARGGSLDAKPIVFQANKRDLPNVDPLERIIEEYGHQVVPTIATRSIGTLEALQNLVGLIEHQRGS